MSLLYEDKPTEYIVSSCGKFGTNEIIDELIRCKDCEHCDSYTYSACFCSYWSEEVLMNDYCSNAVRKENE